MVLFREACRPAYRAIVGLTGTIASGKSHARDVLRDLGACTVDADAVAHEAYRRGTPCFDAVVAAFGAAVVGVDGEIDRRRLGGIVFADAAALQRLNELVWPAVRQLVVEKLDAQAAERAQQQHRDDRDDAPPPRRQRRPLVGVVEAALLFESGWAAQVDEVWLTYVPDVVAVRRLHERNGLDEGEARRRLALQQRSVSTADKLAAARVAVDTSGAKAVTRGLIEREWAALMERLSRGDVVAQSDH